jgi:hypothetical protein
MNFSKEDVALIRQGVSFTGLLMATLICSQIIFWGLVFTVSAILSLGILGSGSPEKFVAFGKVALILLLAGPYMFSFYLNPRWAGLTGVILAIPSLVAGGLVIWLIGFLFSITGLSSVVDTDYNLSLTSGLFAGVVVTLLFLCSGRRITRLDIAGAGSGWVVGIIFSLVVQWAILFFPKISFPALSDRSFLFASIAFGWVSLSIIFFSELLTRRVGWYGFAIWLFMLNMWASLFFVVNYFFLLTLPK